MLSCVLFCSEWELVWKVDEWCRWTRETPSFNVTRPETRRWGGHIWGEVGWQNWKLGGGVAKFPHFPQGLYFAFATWSHIPVLWTNILKSSRFRVWVDYGGGSVRVGYKRVSEAAKRRKVGGACNNLLTLSSNGLSRCFRRKQDQTCLDRSASWSLILIKGPSGSRGRPTGFPGVKG